MIQSVFQNGFMNFNGSLIKLSGVKDEGLVLEEHEPVR